MATSEGLAAAFEQAIDTHDRRRLGAVYTPPDVVRFMVGEALAARVAAGLEIPPDHSRAVLAGELAGLAAADRVRLARLLSGLRILDPAAGAGAFLVGAARELAAVAERLRAAGLTGLSALRSPRAALERCCHGFEIDPEAAAVAVEVLAAAMADDVSERRRRSDRGETLGTLITTCDALRGFAHATAPGGWDIVLMNPPYVGEKFLRDRLGAELQAKLRARDGFAGDLLSHFLLRGLEALAPKGALSAIVSDTTLTMESALPVRSALLDRSRLFSVAWCRPFSAVAVRGGIVTATAEAPARESSIDVYEPPLRASVERARRRTVPSSAFDGVPSRPLFRPSAAARRIATRWEAIDDLPDLWRAVGRRGDRGALDASAAAAAPGEWTLLGAAVQAGQGLATGDDRRFVGLVAGTDAGRRALQRQHRLLDALRNDDARGREWSIVKRLLAQGRRPDDALLALLELRDAGEIGDLPERKPFRIVEPGDVRRSPLDPEERRNGIAAGPRWVPYETADRSDSGGGRRWRRSNPVAIDWSCEAVALLRHRRDHGPRRPVLRHEALWFSPGVTHNRIASHLRARLLPEHSIFSSESPIYLPRAPWLDTWSLLALLNAPVAEFALKTFLASRNHIEVGHVRRLPVPVLTGGERERLATLARRAHAIAADGPSAELHDVEAELDLVTRRLYGMRAGQRLTIAR